MAKIVFLEAVQNFGGARKSTVELAERLSKYNEVEIIDVYGTCNHFLEACHKSGLKVSILDQRTSPFLISSGNKFKVLLNYIYFFFYIISINKKLISLLNKNEKYIMIINNSKVLSFLYKKPKNVEVVFFARGWFVNQQITRIDRFLYKKLVDRFIAVSEATRHALFCSGISSLENIDVVHNAIQVTQRVPRSISGTVKILAAGGFLPAKGHRVILGIAKMLKERGVNFEITIAGIVYKGEASKKFYEEICKTIKEEGLDDNVRIVVDSNDVNALFKWCDIFCHASDTEGLPRVVMEAMSYGKPVVANAVGGVSDYILHGYTGFITRHNNVEDYVDYIQLLLNDPDVYERISQRAWDLVNETYTPSLQIEKLNKVLQIR